MPRDKRNVIKRIHDWTLPLGQHLQVVNVLNVVALNHSDLPIDHHVFGVECSKDRLVIVEHFDIDIREFVRMRNADLAIRI